MTSLAFIQDQKDQESGVLWIILGTHPAPYDLIDRNELSTQSEGSNHEMTYHKDCLAWK